MSSYPMLDIAFPPEDPASLVAELGQLGARAVALYALNWSVPGSVQSPTYVSAVRSAGIAILPIVVPSNAPGPVATVRDVVRSWGAAGWPVAIDLERYSEPSASWVLGAIDALHDLGCSVGLYAGRTDQGLYGGLPWDWLWLSLWTYVDPIDPPVPYDAQQWTNWTTAPSGRRYDSSRVRSTLRLWGMEVPTAAATAGGDSAMIQVPGPVPDEFHLFGILAGNLLRVSTPSGGGGLGAMERWLSQEGNGPVSHGAPEGRRLVPGTLAGGRCADGQGGIRVEVRALDEGGGVWSYAIRDDGSEAFGWRELPLHLDLPDMTLLDAADVEVRRWLRDAVAALPRVPSDVL